MTSNPVYITVCTACRAAGVEREKAAGKDFLAAIQSIVDGDMDIIVRPTECLSVCKRICTVSLSGEGKYTFLFGDLDPHLDAQAVVTMAKACAVAQHGFVPWKERPEVLRKSIIARIPPPDWSPEDGSAPK